MNAYARFNFRLIEIYYTGPNDFQRSRREERLIDTQFRIN